ncbi:hypothetical protein [Actinosynnema sp. NPDC023587]|uniref:hypothetical protein n=1 Tax=Actinosynnema sp. NPDC023587 TaxID=3154695 RepID=UPI0033D093A1
MLSSRSTVAVSAGLAALLAAPAAAVAAPPVPAPSDTAQPSVEIQYHPGDTAPEHGPNSYVITVSNCTAAWYVEYRWGTRSGSIKGECRDTISVSIAPLGATEYPLQWRTCNLRWGKKPPLPFYLCGSYRQDVVRTG